METRNLILSLLFWEDHIKSIIFCFFTTFIILKGWLVYVFALASLFSTIFMVLTRCVSREKLMIELKVTAPPPMNTVEQLLAPQNGMSELEQNIQDGNIILLKFQALLFSLFPQATEKLAVAMVIAATMMAFVPGRYLLVVLFVELFTRYSPPRRASTERLMRRLREWWFSIPAAPVILQHDKNDKKKKN